jgi:hypothetical protein
MVNTTRPVSLCFARWPRKNCRKNEQKCWVQLLAPAISVCAMPGHSSAFLGACPERNALQGPWKYTTPYYTTVRAPRQTKSPRNLIAPPEPAAPAGMPARSRGQRRGPCHRPDDVGSDSLKPAADAAAGRSDAAIRLSARTSTTHA